MQFLIEKCCKIDAERTKTAEEHRDEGYPVAYTGTQGTVFIRNIKRIFNTENPFYGLRCFCYSPIIFIKNIAVKRLIISPITAGAIAPRISFTRVFAKYTARQ